MVIDIPKSEILEYEKMKIITELTMVREKILLFEQKYGNNLKKFTQEMKSQKENFKQWDDHIEWTAYVKTKHTLEKKLEELEHAQDVNITQD